MTSLLPIGPPYASSKRISVSTTHSDACPLESVLVIEKAERLLPNIPCATMAPVLAAGLALPQDAHLLQIRLITGVRKRPPSNF